MRITLFLSLLLSALLLQVSEYTHESRVVATAYSMKGFSALANLLSKPKQQEPVLSADSKIRVVVHEVLKQRAKSLSEDEIYVLTAAIMRYSAKHNHDPLLVLAVIETESSFRQKVVSRKGAVGLMQIRPFVAKAQAKELNISEVGATQLLDPATNVMIGTYYLAKMRKRFGGDLSLALEAYNRGPTKLGRTLRKGHKLKTRYTNKVLRSRQRLQDMVKDV